MNMLRFSGLKCLLILSILCYLTRPVLSDCGDAATFVEGFDYFPDKVYFQSNIYVTYHNNYIILTDNIVPAAPKVYVLYCTAAQPKVAGIPANSNYIQVPMKDVAVTDRTVISFLEILGEEKTSLKYIGDKTTITSPCIQKYVDLYGTISVSDANQVSNVGIIFTNTQPQNGGKFVRIPPTDELPALKRAEWIKFISLFFNKTSVANEAYDKIRNNYLCHMDNLSNVPKETRKTIAWVAIEADSTFTVEYDSYYPNVTMDAGAFPLESQITSDLTAEDLQKTIEEAYIVIDMSELPDNTFDTWKRLFKYDKVPNLPRFLREKRLFRTNKLLNSNGYDDWTERSTSRPDLVLQDLIAIQYPLYQKDYIVNWLDKFAETGDNVILSADKCDDTTFGLPKTDFGTCTPMKFLGDGRDNSGKQIGSPDNNKHNNNNNNNDNQNNDNKSSNVKPGVIIAVALIGSSVALGLGIWLLVVARRRYRERFVKLNDEPVVQMNNVKEVSEVAEVKVEVK